MKIETQPREDHQVRVIAELEPELMEKYMHQAARKISQEGHIAGFRPGKAPYDLVKRTYGEDIIQKQAVEILVDDIYPQVLDQAELKPSYPGSLDEIISINPAKVAFVIPLQPEVELCDYRAVRVDYAPEPVKDEDVEKVLRNLQKNYATAEPVDRAAQDGDMVFITVSGILVEPQEGEDDALISDSPLQFLLGSEEEDDNFPFEGFSKNLTGLSANEEKVVAYTYPEDSEYEKLQGRKAEFTVKVQSVKSLSLPELNDEFAQSVGEFETMDNLRADIRKKMEENANQEYDRDYLTRVIDQIISESTIKYPPQMLEEEMHQLLHSLEDDLGRQHMDIPTYLKTLNTTEEKFIEEQIKPAAQRRLKRSLALDHFANQEKISLNKEEFDAEVMEMLGELEKMPNSRKQSKEERKNLVGLVQIETANRLINRQIMERLKQIATGTFVPAEATAEEKTDAASVSSEEKAES